mmetsp:Transcript_49492/g.107772  ORF Transcript_49492/g.107772 Transcript_49492/m.107772 type:complete len:241 (-) Transcript_49492:96-818(-)
MAFVQVQSLGLGAPALPSLSPSRVGADRWRRRDETQQSLSARALEREPRELGRALASAAAVAAVATFARGARSSWRSRAKALRRTPRSAATAFDIDIKKKVDQKTESQTATSRDMWAVMVHAPIRNCHMPWCKIPGLRRVICTCLKDGITPPTSGGASIRSKDGKCALTVTEYAEVISEGVPILPRSKSYEVASRLFESAMQNDIGTAMVIGTFKKGAEEYEQRLKGLGLWVSIAPVDND